MSDQHDYGKYSARDMALIAVGYFMADKCLDTAEAARYASWNDKNDIDKVLPGILACMESEMANMKAGGEE